MNISKPKNISTPIIKNIQLGPITIVFLNLKILIYFTKQFPNFLNFLFSISFNIFIASLLKNEFY